tara:strand:+ start:1107 stop:1673 length:567 start_codon:yes stop_codon:yes gene_type:complete
VIAKIAFFDLDHTLVKVDSMLAFATHVNGKKALYFSLLSILPKYVQVMLGLRSHQALKEAFLEFHFKDLSITELEKQAQLFIPYLDQNLDPKRFLQLKELKKEGYEICIVTASCATWVKPWSQLHGFQLIASEMEFQEDKFTGKLAGKNCKGQEKVRRINAQFNLDNYSSIKAYGNGKSDRYMLQLAK